MSLATEQQQPSITSPGPLGLWRTLLADEAGIATTSDLVLIAVMLGGIVIVGIGVVRDSLVQELNDSAVAAGALNQSYQANSATTLGAASSGSGFADQNDVGDSTGIEIFPVCGLDDPSPSNILE